MTSNVYKNSLTSDTDDDLHKEAHSVDTDSINDSSLSDAIADILDLSFDKKTPVKSAQESARPGLREIPYTTAKPPIYPRNCSTDENESTSTSDDDDDTPPMPVVYLSSESLDLQALSLKRNLGPRRGLVVTCSLSRSSEERFEYEGDFEDCETGSNATDYDISSICSSPSQSTHDLSLLSDDDLLDQGHLDYWEDVTYNFVASYAPHDTPVSSDDIGNQKMSPTAPQESHVASGDIDNQKISPNGPQVSPVLSDDIDVQKMSTNGPQESPVVSDDIDNQKVSPTATSFHFSKEESTSSSMSSIDEEITSTIMENESSAAVDMLDIQPNTDTALSKVVTSLEGAQHSLTPDIEKSDSSEEHHYSVSKEIMLDDLANDYAISTNEGNSSDGTSQDVSPIMSSPETPVAEDILLVDKDLQRQADYWENTEFCFSNKPSLAVLSEDTGQIAAPQESPVASDDIDNQKMSPTYPQEPPVAFDDIPSQTLIPTAASFHFSKEESKPISETSSIAEEIASAICENESSVAVDLMEIEPDTDTILPEGVACLQVAEHSISPSSVKEGFSPSPNEDTSLFSTPPSSPEPSIREQLSHTSSSETTSVSINLIPSSLESISLTDSCDSLPDISDTNKPKTLAAAGATAVSKLREDEKVDGIYDNYLSIPTGEEVTSAEADVECPMVSDETPSSSSSLDLDNITAAPIDIDTSHDVDVSEPALLKVSKASMRLIDSLTTEDDNSSPVKPSTTTARTDKEEHADLKDETEGILESILEDRSRLLDEVKDLTSECDHLHQDKKRLSYELTTIRIQIHALIDDKQSIAEKAQAQVQSSSDIIQAKNANIKALEDDILWCTSEANRCKEENLSLLADIQALQSTVDKQRIVAENWLQENAALKQDAGKVTSLSQDEKQALTEMSSMTEELIDENSELKIKLVTATEEKKGLNINDKLSKDLDELVWEYKELEEYNILLEDILNESDREAAVSRKESDNINVGLEMENALLHDNLHHLQSQSREERKANYLFGTRKLKAIQDLERRLIDLKSENNTIKEHLLAEKSKSYLSQSTLEEFQKQEENQRNENQALREELERSSKHQVDLHNELAEMNRLLQESKDIHLDHQAIVAHNNKLMVQNATLQGFIEQRRLGFSRSNLGSSDGNQSSLPTDTSSSTSVTSSMTTEPDQEVHQMTTSETSDELAPVLRWRENVKLMFEEQNKQLASFQQLLMGEVLDVKCQLAESNAAKSVTTVERVEESESDAASDLSAATNVDGNSNFSRQVATLEGDVQSLKDKITELEKINAQIVALSLQKDSKIECLMGVVDVLTAKNNKLKHEKNELRTLVKGCQLTMVQLKEQNIDEVSFIEEKYHHHKTKTDQLIDTIEADLYNREKELEAAEHKLRMSNIAARQLPGLEEHLEAAEKTITFLSTALDEKTKTCRRLQEEAAEADVAGLWERNKDLSGELAEAEQELKNVRQEKRENEAKLAKANSKVIQMENLLSAVEVKHRKDNQNMAQQDFRKHNEQAVMVNEIGQEGEAKAKMAVWAGDTAKAHGKEQATKVPKRTAHASKAPSEGWNTANIMVVSKEGMMKAMFEEQEHRLKEFMQNNLERSANQIEQLRRKLNKVIYKAAESKSTFGECDKNTDDDSSDLTETLSDVSSASYHTTQSTEDSVISGSESDIRIYQEPITEQQVKSNAVDTEDTDITPFRGLV